LPLRTARRHAAERQRSPGNIEHVARLGRVVEDRNLPPPGVARLKA
jgi:hypothetical protein